MGKRLIRVLFFLNLIFCYAHRALALPAQEIQTKDSPPFNNYYTIDDFNEESFLNFAEQNRFQSPQELISIEPLVQIQSGLYNLLAWVDHRQPPDWPKESYDREKQFGRWISNRYDDNCYNTRAKVLIRDSKSNVQFKDSSKCVVESGNWVDPYTEAVFTQAKELQIDHLVPLKNAYTSGAWKWERTKKCAYTNFLSNGFHLLTVSGKENMKKGDRSPAEYLPPNRNIICSYLQAWLTVKIIWQLALMPPEAFSIAENLRKYQCQLSNMKLQRQYLEGQRSSVSEEMKPCQQKAK